MKVIANNSKTQLFWFLIGTIGREELLIGMLLKPNCEN